MKNILKNKEKSLKLTTLGFTLIELLAVIVILAIIALIATPIILNIINNTQEESNQRSIEMYADAIKNAVANHQLVNNKSVLGKFTTSDGKTLNGNVTLKVEYDGNVVCKNIVIFEDGNIYLNECEVNEELVEYTYGKENIPEPVSFSSDSWETISKNVQIGNLTKYNVGATREVVLTGVPNIANENKTYTVRIANTSTPKECSNAGFSQTACGFVVEFEDIITIRPMNSTNTNIGGWRDCEMREYVNEIVFSGLPEDLRQVIINTEVVSGYELGKAENYKTKDKLYFLSTKEVFGKKLSYEKVEETRQLDYYEGENVTTSNYLQNKKNYNNTSYSWWLRSAIFDIDYAFYAVFNSGNTGYYGAKYEHGVSPAFRIG